MQVRQLKGTAWLLAFFASLLLWPIAVFCVIVLFSQLFEMRYLLPLSFLLIPFPACYLLFTSAMSSSIKCMLMVLVFIVLGFAFLPRAACSCDEDEGVDESIASIPSHVLPQSHVKMF